MARLTRRQLLALVGAIGVAVTSFMTWIAMPWDSRPERIEKYVSVPLAYLDDKTAWTPPETLTQNGFEGSVQFFGDAGPALPNFPAAYAALAAAFAVLVMGRASTAPRSVLVVLLFYAFAQVVTLAVVAYFEADVQVCVGLWFFLVSVTVSATAALLRISPPPRSRIARSPAGTQPAA